MVASNLLSLLKRREELIQQLSAVNAQIIQETLTGAQVAAKLPAAVGAGARRKWFERGEMVKLARKILTGPMAQAELVRALAGAKGYDKGLSTTEKARFKSAAYQAIAAALAAKQIARNKQGQVHLARS